jgi:uncharacterized membrane protein YfcA
VTPIELILAALAAAAGGAINAIAGGGTLVTFPAIVALGVPPLVANATNTVSLWPGSLGSVWGYRQHLGNLRPWLVRFTIPSLIGGAAGGWLLLATGEQRFAQIVPWLVLAATLLFMAQGPVQRWAHGHQAPVPPEVPPPGVLAWQFGVAVYGGYFGAGMGILMLAAIGFMGHTDIHRMNGLKNWSGTCINAVAAMVFVASGVVNWPLAGAMIVGAIVGGYGGARLAQRVGREAVRKAVVAIGIAATGYLLVWGG